MIDAQHPEDLLTVAEELLDALEGVLRAGSRPNRATRLIVPLWSAIKAERDRRAAAPVAPDQAQPVPDCGRCPFRMQQRSVRR